MTETNIETLIEDFMQATYDTGCYCGDGRSGTPLHQQAIKERREARAALEAGIAAAIQDPTGYWIKQVETARRQAKDNLRLAAERASEIADLRKEIAELRQKISSLETQKAGLQHALKDWGGA